MRTILAWALAAGVASGAALALSGSARGSGDQPRARNSAELVDRIDRWRERTWYWQRLMAKPRYPTAYLERTQRSLAFRQWALELWKTRAVRARSRALQLPNRRHWLCLFRYERDPDQGWRTNTGNGYYGGLQMDLTFQRRYGGWLLRRKGLAHRWTAMEQIWVAERARRVQGWYAWPNAARACGLI